jgi:cell division inhibitor SulA/protein ImuA
MNRALASLLEHPAIWRGADCAPEPAALPTGFAPLDDVLPGGGWPGNALTEVLLAREGIGELRVTLPALARLAQTGRDIVWIAPPHQPYAPALAASGIELSRLALVRCHDAREALWAFEQALRAPECGAAFAWLACADERSLRRLAVAAREGRTWGVLWRRPGVGARTVAAALRLALDAQDSRLAVRVLKRRGGEVASPVLLDVAPRWSTAPSEPLARAAFHSRVPPKLKRVTDERTSAGRDVAPTRVRRNGAAS